MIKWFNILKAKFCKNRCQYVFEKKIKKEENPKYNYFLFPLLSERDSPSSLDIICTTLTSEYVTSTVSICKGIYKFGESKMLDKKKNRTVLTVLYENFTKVDKLYIFAF